MLYFFFFLYFSIVFFIFFLQIRTTGHTLKIPDSVMGLTFIAAGTSIPEVVSSLIVSRQGKGAFILLYSSSTVILCYVNLSPG